MVQDLYSGGPALNRCALLLPVLLLLSGCTRPAEVFVTLDGDGWWLQQVSFRGCSWSGLLEAQESTTIGSCVEGTGAVSFQARPDPGTEPPVVDSDSGDADSGETDASEWRWYATDERFRVKAGEVQQLRVVPEAWTALP